MTASLERKENNQMQVYYRKFIHRLTLKAKKQQQILKSPHSFLFTWRLSANHKRNEKNEIFRGQCQVPWMNEWAMWTFPLGSFAKSRDQDRPNVKFFKPSCLFVVKVILYISRLLDMQPAGRSTYNNIVLIIATLEISNSSWIGNLSKKTRPRVNLRSRIFL